MSLMTVYRQNIIVLNTEINYSCVVMWLLQSVNFSTPLQEGCFILINRKKGGNTGVEKFQTEVVMQAALKTFCN